MTAPARDLSPRHLTEALGPAWQLDHPFVADLCPYDAYRHEQRETVLLELVAPGRRLQIEVSPRPVQHPAASAAGLALTWRSPGPPDAGEAVCRRLAQLLRDRLGPAPQRWRVLPASLRHTPTALAAELRWTPARIADDPDRILLSTDADHYARLYGTRSMARRLAATHGDGPGISIHYPAPRRGALPPSGAIYPAPARVVHRRRMRTYFAQLGCLFDAHGFPRTVPTPNTLASALADRPGLARLRPRMLPNRGPSLRASTWAGWITAHVLPISVAPTWAVQTVRVLRRARRLQRIPIDVGMLVHDVSLHALGFHAISREAWDALVTRANRHRHHHPSRVAAFFEETLTHACWTLWRELDAPEQFATAFERDLDSLLRELDALGPPQRR